MEEERLPVGKVEEEQVVEARPAVGVEVEPAFPVEAASEAEVALLQAVEALGVVVRPGVGAEALVEEVEALRVVEALAAEVLEGAPAVAERLQVEAVQRRRPALRQAVRLPGALLSRSIHLPYPERPAYRRAW